MFLIQWKKGEFINAEYIDDLKLLEDKVLFTLTGDNENFYKVDEDLQSKFLNNLQALNCNIDDVESFQNRLSEGKV